MSKEYLKRAQNIKIELRNRSKKEKFRHDYR